MTANLYRILQVDPSAHAVILSEAYRYLAAFYHPNNGETGNSKSFNEVSDAYKILSDPAARAEYDASLNQMDVARINPTGTLYQLLQVGPDAHSAVIRQAYRFLAAQFHPDNDGAGDREKFYEITEAWKLLSDDTRRAEYDDSL